MHAKIIEERTRWARELNHNVWVLPLPHPFLDLVDVGAMFLSDTIDLLGVTLERAWLGSYYLSNPHL